MDRKSLEKSLQNLATVITEGRILVNGNSLTGKEINQLFRDLSSIGDALQELDKYRLQLEVDKKTSDEA